MTGIGRDEPNSLRASMAPIRVAEIGSYKCSSALTATWISLSKRSRVKTKRASKAPIYMRTHLMGKRRKEHPEDNVFVNNLLSKSCLTGRIRPRESYGQRYATPSMIC